MPTPCCLHARGYSGLFVPRPQGFYVPDTPMVGVSVEARAIGTVAEVSVTQLFQNREADLLDFVYVFPLHPDAAVVAFKATVDGETVTGQIRAKEQAQAEYNAAVARGDGAFLVDQDADDTFQLSVGNVRPGSSIEVALTYVSELRYSENHTEFVLPTTIAPKYGPARVQSLIPFDLFWRKRLYYAPPGPQHTAELRAPRVDSAPFRLAFELLLRGGSVLSDVSSPSHALEVHTDGPKAAVSLRDDLTEMDRDLVIQWSTVEEHAPQVFVEQSTDSTTTAAMLTMCPAFHLDAPPAEFWFVLDRSGSMAGAKMEQLRTALTLFLRSLPVDCVFNVVGFGSQHRLLFPGGVRKYSQSSLAEASAYCNTLKADMGGTEILAPLQSIFGKPIAMGRSRQIFVLTDGQVRNTEAVCAEIARRKGAQTRVFTLGLGTSVSHDLVNRMARAGDGVAEFAVDTDLSAKVVAQLGRAMQPALRNVCIEWRSEVDFGAPMEVDEVEVAPQPTAATFSLDGDFGSLLGHRKAERNKAKLLREHAARSQGDRVKRGLETKGVVSAPSVPPPIFDGTAFVAFAIFAEGRRPTHVRVTADSPDGKLDATLPIANPAQAPRAMVLHQLAARRLIREIDEEVPGTLLQFGPSAIAKNEITQLGLRYSLMSRHTSFIAIERRSDMDRMLTRMSPKVATTVPILTPDRPTTSGFMASRAMFKCAEPKKKKKASTISKGDRSFAAFAERERGRRSELAGDRRSSESRRSAPAPAPAPMPSAPMGGAMPMPSVPMGGGAMPIMQPSMVVPQQQQQQQQYQTDMFDLAPPTIQASMCDESDDDEMDDIFGLSAAQQSGGDMEQLKQIVSLQQFDGSFLPSEQLTRALGGHAVLATPPAGIAPGAWATAVVIAYLQAMLYALQSEWALVVAKAESALKQLAGGAAGSTKALDMAKGAVKNVAGKV